MINKISAVVVILLLVGVAKPWILPSPPSDWFGDAIISAASIFALIVFTIVYSIGWLAGSYKKEGFKISSRNQPSQPISIIEIIMWCGILFSAALLVYIIFFS